MKELYLSQVSLAKMWNGLTETHRRPNETEAVYHARMRARSMVLGLTPNRQTRTHAVQKMRRHCAKLQRIHLATVERRVRDDLSVQCHYTPRQRVVGCGGHSS